MRVADVTLAEIRNHLASAFSTVSLSAGGQISRVSIDNFVLDAERIITAQPDVEFVFTAEIFQPSSPSTVTLEFYALPQPATRIMRSTFNLGWNVAERVVATPVIQAVPTP